MPDINLLRLFVVSMVLAAVAEGMVEYVVGILANNVMFIFRLKWLTPYIALLVGIGLALHYQLDFIAALGEPISPVGQLISGLLIGRGSGFLHDFWKTYILRDRV